MGRFYFVDFANVDKWFAEDNRDWDNNILGSNSKLSVDLEKLLSFPDVSPIISGFITGIIRRM